MHLPSAASCHWISSDAAQKVIKAADKDKKPRLIQVTFEDGSIFASLALVSQRSWSGAVDGVVTGAFNFRLTGEPLEMEAPGPLKIPGADKGLGVFLTILGEQAQAVEDFEVELADKRAQESLEAAQDGKAKPHSTKRTLQDNRERAMVRVVGWRGLTETYSPELACTLLANNPDFVDQVLAESRKRGNFTKA